MINEKQINDNIYSNIIFTQSFSEDVVFIPVNYKLIAERLRGDALEFLQKAILLQVNTV